MWANHIMWISILLYYECSTIYQPTHHFTVLMLSNIWWVCRPYNICLAEIMRFYTHSRKLPSWILSIIKRRNPNGCFRRNPDNCFRRFKGFTFASNRFFCFVFCFLSIVIKKLFEAKMELLKLLKWPWGIRDA